MVIVALTLIFLLGPHHENRHSCYMTICFVSGVLLFGYVKDPDITLKNFLLESLITSRGLDSAAKPDRLCKHTDYLNRVLDVLNPYIY